MTDAEVIEATRQGDREAFALLVARYQRMVEGIAFSVCGEPTLIDDIVQDTFVTAWRTIDRLRDAHCLRGWLGGIARNVGRNARRRRNNRREAPLAEVTAPETAFDQIADQQCALEVQAALARLPRRYREPIVLFYYEHCTVKEVAEALAMREDAVMQRLSRGRRRLGEELATRVEIDLERRPSRAALAAALLLLLPVRTAAAAPVTPWWHGLAAHWRIPAGALAVAGAAVVLMAAVQRSNEIAAHAAAPPEPAAKREDKRPEAPKLPEPRHADYSQRTYRTILIPSTDAAESCARGARTLVYSVYGWPAIKKIGDNWYPILDQPPEVEALLDKVAARAAADCAGEPVPEIYMICEGAFEDVVEGHINCYPHDPFAI